MELLLPVNGNSGRENVGGAGHSAAFLCRCTYGVAWAPGKWDLKPALWIKAALKGQENWQRTVGALYFKVTLKFLNLHLFLKRWDNHTKDPLKCNSMILRFQTTYLSLYLNQHSKIFQGIRVAKYKAQKIKLEM